MQEHDDWEQDDEDDSELEELKRKVSHYLPSKTKFITLRNMNKMKSWTQKMKSWRSDLSKMMRIKMRKKNMNLKKIYIFESSQFK